MNGQFKQIILSNSFRISDDFLKQTNRYNGKNKKLPHFLVKKSGEVLSLYDIHKKSEYMLVDGNKISSIYVCFENLGWLERVPTKEYFTNWVGNIKKDDIYEKKWRDYFFWDIYSEEQIKSSIKLCKKIMTENNIMQRFIGHNTKINDVKDFNGIVSRSNYSTFYTDINPSFPFHDFKNMLENEE
jgi:hypothetical protein